VTLGTIFLQAATPLCVLQVQRHCQPDCKLRLYEISRMLLITA